ncbi:MAG: Hint domain-containing protein [Rhodospirillales bacterium]
MAIGGGTVTNAGTISGAFFSVYNYQGAAFRLAIAPDAVFSGVVDGGNSAGSSATSTLELTSGASTGTLTSLGSQFVRFTSIDIDANSHWIVDGAIGAAYTVDNAGTLNNAGTAGVALTLGSNDFVTNRSGGRVVGSNDGIDSVFGSTISNAGSIGGTDVGVYLFVGGSVVNTTSGRIAGSLGINSQGTATAVDNAGSIDATNIAIRLGDGGSATNQSSGALSGTRFGIASYLTASVANAGIIIGTTYKGVFLGGGGMLTNTGTILGNNGAETAGPSTVVNAGIVAGTATATTPGYSIGLFVHGTTDSVTNQSSGTISGYIGVEAISNLGLDNSGRILGDLTNVYGAGVFAAYSGSAATAAIVNRAGGTISGSTGVEGQGAVSLTNSGLIVGGSAHRAYGAFLAASGSFLTNLSGGTIAGSIGVLIGTGSTIVNSGKIVGNVVGDNYGILAFTGGAITNLSTGIIDNISTGPTGTTTIFNAGTIGNGTVAIASSHNTIANRIVVAPGAVFLGAVNGGNGVLEFTSSATTGTVTGLGSKYLNFSALDFDAGAHWTLGSDNTIAFGVTVETGGTLTLNNSTFADTGTLVNNGGIVLDPSTMVVGNLLGSGTLTIQAGSTLEVAGSIASTETIVFAGDHAYLHLGNPTNAHGVIVGFDNTDRIDLAGIAPGSVSYAAGHLYFGVGGTLSVTTAGGNPLQTVASATGTEITALCFLPDTLIETPDGQVRVQDLKTGDIVTTFSGAHRPISWIGTGSVLATRGKRGPATPVIVRKHALGHGMPFYDLRVTKGHSFLLDGVLIPVEFLVNHRTIEWDDRAKEVTLYHVELETHDILIANGAPAESYRDDGNRWLFQNANSGWDQPAKEPCAPVLTGGPIVDAVWRRLLERATDRPGLPMTEEPDIHLLVDGVRMDGTCFDDGRRQFEIVGNSSEIRIVSRAGAPAEFGLSRDPRVLGIAIRALRCWQGPKLRVIGANDAALRDGFHAYEAEHGFRWTNGDALVPPELAAGVAGVWQLDIVVASTARYPLLVEDSLAA